ncbi:MAG: hypothetical protein ACT4QF_07520 [Sporichthyaceae bacterium]
MESTLAGRRSEALNLAVVRRRRQRRASVARLAGMARTAAVPAPR